MALCFIAGNEYAVDIKFLMLMRLEELFIGTRIKSCMFWNQIPFHGKVWKQEAVSL